LPAGLKAGGLFFAVTWNGLRNSKFGQGKGFSEKALIISAECFPGKSGW